MSSLVTQVVGKEFLLSVTEESDLSVDGGYSFEDVTSTYFLSEKEALSLASELLAFCNKASQQSVNSDPAKSAEKSS